MLASSYGLHTNSFDPGKWNQVYASEYASGIAVVFRRSAEIAGKTHSRLARPGEFWLDIGCGTGHLAHQMAANRCKVVGIDVDPSMVEFAQRQASQKGLDELLKFQHGTAGKLPFDEDSVDGVASVSLIGCLSAPSEFLQETARVLRPGGKAVITFTNRMSLLLRTESALKRAGIEKSIKPDGEGHLKRPYTSGNLRLFSVSEARRLVEQAGLQVREIQYYNFFTLAGRLLIPTLLVARVWEKACPPLLARFLARNFLLVGIRA